MSCGDLSRRGPPTNFDVVSAGRFPFEKLLERAGAGDDELLAWMRCIHAVVRPETVLLLRPFATDEDRPGLVRLEATRLIDSFPRGRCVDR